MATDDFKRIFETLRVAVVVTDARGAIQYANSALGELAGSAERAVQGTSLAGLFAAEDRKRVQQNLARVGEGKASSAFFDTASTSLSGMPSCRASAARPVET